MRQELKYWNRIAAPREGVFNGYTVKGTKYKTGDEIAWHVEAHEQGGTKHEYWVQDGEFYAVDTKPYKNTYLITIKRPAVTESIDPTERDAILEALDQWNTAIEDHQIVTTFAEPEKS